MAACGGLQLIFDKPLPENPTLLESLSSWNQIKSPKPIEDSSFTDIFGELHFKENPESLPPSAHPLSSSSSSSPSSLSSSSSSSSSMIYLTPQARGEKLDKDKSQSSNNNEGSIKNQSSDYFSSSHKEQYVGSHKYSDSFSSMNSESLQLCTEGLGFESSDDVEDLKTDMSNDRQNQDKISITKHTPHENLAGEFRRSRSSGGTFPPPISSIGKSGKPWVCFKSYRHDGRFVLKEIRIPTQEFLHARREDGRLKLQFLQSDDEILEEEEEEEEEQDEEEEYDCDDNDDHDSDPIDEKEEENSAEENVQLNSNGVGGGGDS